MSVSNSTPGSRDDRRPGGTPGNQELSRAERSRRTRELLEQAHATNDTELRKELLDEVILLNRCVAEALANRYRGRGVAVEDLQQAALEGLVKAVHRFDPTVRPDLLTYAVPTIRGEIQRWFRDQSWMVRPPRRLQEMQWRISRTVEELSQDLGREPNGEELLEHMECSARELDEAVQAFGCFQPPSLDRPVADASGSLLADVLPAEDDGDRSAAEARLALAPVVRELGDRDRRILYLRFFEDRSQQDIGEQLGVTQMQVSRLLDRILRDLRAQLV
jgi:RNA polymerase sigma-B factor